MKNKHVKKLTMIAVCIVFISLLTIPISSLGQIKSNYISTNKLFAPTEYYYRNVENNDSFYYKVINTTAQQNLVINTIETNQSSYFLPDLITIDNKTMLYMPLVKSIYETQQEINLIQKITEQRMVYLLEDQEMKTIGQADFVFETAKNNKFEQLQKTSALNDKFTLKRMDVYNKELKRGIVINAVFQNDYIIKQVNLENNVSIQLSLLQSIQRTSLTLTYYGPLSQKLSLDPLRYEIVYTINATNGLAHSFKVIQEDQQIINDFVLEADWLSQQKQLDISNGLFTSELHKLITSAPGFEFFIMFSSFIVLIICKRRKFS